MLWRSGARGGAARALPAASAGVDGSVVRATAFILGVKGGNRAHASWLGARRRSPARRQRGVAHRGIGFRPRRPRPGRGARDRCAPIRSRRGACGNRPHSRLIEGNPRRRRRRDFHPGRESPHHFDDAPNATFGVDVLALCRRPLYSRRSPPNLRAPEA